MSTLMRIGSWVIFAGLLLNLVTSGVAENPLDDYQQFSALASGGPLKWNKLKVYRSGNQMRGEYPYEKEYRIANEKQRNGWVVRPLDGKTPKECQRMTLPDFSSYPFFAYTADRFDVERTSTPASKETFDGHSCTVEEYAVKLKEGGAPLMMKVWRAEDLKGFPVQIGIKPSSRPEYTITYSDVSLEKPDPKLFQLPPLCHAGQNGGKKPGASSPKKPAAKTSGSKPL